MENILYEIIAGLELELLKTGNNENLEKSDEIIWDSIAKHLDGEEERTAQFEQITDKLNGIIYK